MKTASRPSRAAGSTYHQHLSVTFDYPVCFTRGLFDPHNSLLSSVLTSTKEHRVHKVIVFVDSNLAEADPRLIPSIKEYFKTHAAVLSLVLTPLIVPGGNAAKKNWDTIRTILSVVDRARLCRQSYVMIVGGGSVLDMTGFAASIIHRGLRVIRVPTTVLSQNDAGVGVKTGMDTGDIKNFIGTFWPPFAVINDFDFLKTLRTEDWTGGIAEAFKVAIIKDAAFFRFLVKQAKALQARDEASMETLIRRCAKIHLDHIRESGDPFERQNSRPLDFGHWSAHMLETISNYSVGHGQAVSMGIALDSYYAEQKGALTRAETNTILQGLAESGLPLWHPLLEKREKRGKLALLDGLRRFREHIGGELSLTMPNGIGSSMELHDMDPAIVEEGIQFLRKRQRAFNRETAAKLDGAR